MFKRTTSEMQPSENWELIIEVCDRVGTDNEKARQCFEVVNERMLHRNANVVLYTMTLVDSLLENCGQNVKQEVASRAFTTTMTRVLNDKSVHEKVKNRILGSIQKWAFDFRQDPTLSLIEETYSKLQNQRFIFPSPQIPDKIPKQSELDKQKEEDDLQLALALSLSSTNDHNNRANYQSPAAIRNEITRKQTVAAAAASGGAAPASTAGGVARRTTRATGAAASGPSASVSSLDASALGGAKRRVQVRALYDFTPTEPGELGFFKGDIIDVLDQKYRDWWKGELRGKSGIFPANFVQTIEDVRAEVSKDIDAEVEVFSEAHNIEALLRMLGSVDPMKDNVSDNEEVQKLYSSTLALRPKIIKLIEKYNKKKEELVLLDSQFSKSMRLYDELMQRSVGQQAPAGGYQQQQQQPPQPLQQQPQQQQQQQPVYMTSQPQQQQVMGVNPYGGYSTIGTSAGLAYSQPGMQGSVFAQPQQQQQQSYMMSQGPGTTPQRIIYQMAPQQQQPLNQSQPQLGQQYQPQQYQQSQPQTQSHPQLNQQQTQQGHHPAQYQTPTPGAGGSNTGGGF
ncbi:ESCRT-0 subunit protein hse1 [Coemansia sp. RSA 1722]|nr:ESCRT-0 subunit protein hse1 [Coemansia sp. RSA 485]KAJ2595548.1 ESCRT-0 subunit protein hse1 [Coemansia sp. RSA 1722]